MWLILGGGVIFVVWLLLYVVSFFGFYLVMFVILFVLILCLVGFKFCSKMFSECWCNIWDWVLFIGGFILVLIMGVVVGNVLLGVLFYFDDSMCIFYIGLFFGLLMFFVLLVGLFSVLMLVVYGVVMLVLKIDGLVVECVVCFGSIVVIIVFVLFVVGGVWVVFGLLGY